MRYIAARSLVVVCSVGACVAHQFFTFSSANRIYCSRIHVSCFLFYFLELKTCRASPPALFNNSRQRHQQLAIGDVDTQFLCMGASSFIDIPCTPASNKFEPQN
jgi:hypothetical protein